MILPMTLCILESIVILDSDGLYGSINRSVDSD